MKVLCKRVKSSTPKQNRDEIIAITKVALSSIKIEHDLPMISSNASFSSAASKANKNASDKQPKMRIK